MKHLALLFWAFVMVAHINGVVVINPYSYVSGGAAVSLHGTVSTGIQLTGSQPLTFSHTIASGTNLVLYVLAGIDTASDRNPTATWNGSAMTLVGEVVGSATAQHAAIFRMINPAVGTFNIVISSDQVINTDYILGTGICLANVNQSTSDNGLQTSSGGSATSRSVTITTGATGDMALDVVIVNGNPTLTVGSGQTARSNFTSGDANGTMMGSSTEPGAASVVMDWTFASSSRTSQVGINVRKAP